MKLKTRLLLLATLAPTALLAACSHAPRPIPGGATEAAVFFTPVVRDARTTAGHVFPSQHAEYARRDTHMGIRSASATQRKNLYPARRGYRATTRITETRVLATPQGYRVTESSRTYSSGSASHRHR